MPTRFRILIIAVVAHLILRHTVGATDTDGIVKYRLHRKSGQTIMLVGYREEPGVLIGQLPDGRRITYAKSAIERLESLTDEQIRQVNAPDLDELLATYRGWGLPLPPVEAQLVRFDSGGSIVNGVEESYLHLGFLLSPATDELGPLILVGTRQCKARKCDKLNLIPIDPDDFNLEGIRAEARCLFEINAGIATAIQCKARGWHDLAEALLALSLKVDVGHSHSKFYQPANQSAKTALAFMAWAHWANSLVEANSERADIAKNMKALIATERKLNSESNRIFCMSLDATLVPSVAQAGSVEALIDDLLNLQIATSPMGNLLTPAPWATIEPEPRILRLLQMGFEAVPALIDHLDDRRLTRGVVLGVNNLATFHLPVGLITQRVLEGIGGRPFGFDFFFAHNGRNMDTKAVRDWWQEAQKLDEKTHLLRNARRTDDRSRDYVVQSLWILAKKHPEDLARLYESYAADPRAADLQPSCHDFAEVVAKSSLPLSRRIELLRAATERGEPGVRSAAHHHLSLLLQSDPNSNK
jgi:hypothetical protein